VSSYNEHDINTTVRLGCTFKVGTTLTNPTTVTLSVTKPDGTSSAPSPSNDSTGVYHYDFAVDQVGEWIQVWTGTGACAAVESTRFFVRRFGS
jgi:hypothetical protein